MTDEPNITMTAEQFAARIMKHRVDAGDLTGREEHISAVMQEQFPGVPEEIVNRRLVRNTIDSKLDRQEIEAVREVKRWIDTGQMSLLGMPGPRLPEYMTVDGKKKHWTETTLAESMQDISMRCEFITQEVEEHRKAWEHANDRLSAVQESRKQIHDLILAAEQSGYDPRTLSYEQAKSAALTPHHGPKTGDVNRPRR